MKIIEISIDRMINLLISKDSDLIKILIIGFFSVKDHHDLRSYQ